MAWDGVYMKPNVWARRISGTVYVTVSNIIELESLTITGCAESYENVDYGTNFVCTPTGGTIDAEYYFTDGTSLYEISRNTTLIGVRLTLEKVGLSFLPLDHLKPEVHPQSQADTAEKPTEPELVLVSTEPLD